MPLKGLGGSVKHIKVDEGGRLIDTTLLLKGSP